MRGMRSAAKQPEPTKRPEAANLKQTMAMLLPYLWQFKYRVLLALLALVAAKAAVLLMPVALKYLVDALDASQHSVLALPIALLLLYGALRFATVFFGEVRD
ncbi:MAG TPA: metal ABC transporter permease, partial [Rheinheimera sp.]|nr:metal ABC transporter permease [Rheinheimera sp.]